MKARITFNIHIWKWQTESSLRSGTSSHVCAKTECKYSKFSLLHDIICFNSFLSSQPIYISTKKCLSIYLSFIIKRKVTLNSNNTSSYFWIIRLNKGLSRKSWLWRFIIHIHSSVFKMRKILYDSHFVIDANTSSLRKYQND